MEKPFEFKEYLNVGTVVSLSLSGTRDDERRLLPRVAVDMKEKCFQPVKVIMSGLTPGNQT